MTPVKELKEKGTTHWEVPNTGATNKSGFTGLPGGYRNKSGSLGYIGKEVYWWSSTAESDTDGWERGLVNNASTIDRIGSKKIDRFYIRCIKD
ncbi:MAG: FISUMP domain-containing protein [Bacteroidales bacterium]